MWAAKTTKFGYRWKVGKGTKVKFLEDLWIGSSNLAIQYWEIYSIIHEQNKTIAGLWDGSNLKCTFRRCVDRRLSNIWEEVVCIAESLSLNEEEDELVWMHSSSRIYSSHSLYSIINFRGVMPVFGG
jgi:hypothetical protein